MNENNITNTALALIDKRNYGIDLLKLFSMFLVVFLHTFSHGILTSAQAFTVQYEVGFLLEALAYCCVNCFALASGYIGVDSNFKHRRIIPIWLQVVFYCLIMTVFFMYIKPDWLSNKALIGTTPWINAVTPVLHETYWYFTAYFALIFFIPYLNKGLSHINVKQAYGLILSVIFVYVVIQYFSKKDLFAIGIGYNATWIIILYALGAALNKTKIEKLIKNKWIFLILYIATAALAWGGKYYNEYHSKLAGTFKSDTVFLQYTSLPILLSSIFLLLFFANIKIRKNVVKKSIAFLIPASFGVYLIHVHPLTFQLSFWGKLGALCKQPVYVMIWGAVKNAIIVYIVCLVIDLVRVQLFKLLHIKQIVDVVCDFVNVQVSNFETWLRKKIDMPVTETAVLDDSQETYSVENADIDYLNYTDD